MTRTGIRTRIPRRTEERRVVHVIELCAGSGVVDFVEIDAVDFGEAPPAPPPARARRPDVRRAHQEMMFVGDAEGAAK
jgi:hypothetical protein